MRCVYTSMYGRAAGRGIPGKDNALTLNLKWSDHIHVLYSAYHLQSLGALERYHQTLKIMFSAFFLDYDKD